MPKGKYCVFPGIVYRLAIVMPPTPPPPPPILDDRKWMFIAFLAISDQYSTFIFLILFTKWLPAAILDDRKSLSAAFQLAELKIKCFANARLVTQYSLKERSLCLYWRARDHGRRTSSAAFQLAELKIKYCTNARLATQYSLKERSLCLYWRGLDEIRHYLYTC